jgi:hypothetical protein
MYDSVCIFASYAAASRARTLALSTSAVDEVLVGSNYRGGVRGRRDVIDWAVCMREFPQSALLDVMLKEARAGMWGLPPCVRIFIK